MSDFSNFSDISSNDTLTNEDIPTVAFGFTVFLRILASFGLLMNLIVISVIVRNYNKLNNPMYFFVVNVAIPDIAQLIATISQMLDMPQMLKFPTCLFVMFFIQYTWYLTIFSVLNLSVNRLIAVVFWQHYDTVSKIKSLK